MRSSAVSQPRSRSHRTPGFRGMRARRCAPAAAPPGGGEGGLCWQPCTEPGAGGGGGAAGADPPPPALPCPQTPLRFTRVEGEEGELLRQSVAASWKLGLGPRGGGGGVDRKEYGVRGSVGSRARVIHPGESGSIAGAAPASES